MEPPSFSNLILNEDCLIQILLWLPLISLLRFKSVCKSWRAIIQNPFFIHTHHATTTPSKLLFLRYSYHLSIGDIFSVSAPEFDEAYENLGIPGPEFEVPGDPYPGQDPDRDPPFTSWESTSWDLSQKINTCYYSRYKNITIVGCCNGIICLNAGCSPCCLIRDQVCCTISLWNPAIKQQYRFLPKPFALEEKNHDGENLNYFIDKGLDISPHTVHHLVGFGFDVKTMDYKVLLITYDIYEDRQYFYARGVQVYSLSTNSWKCIDASHAHPNLTICDGDDWRQGHYLNGSYLFIAGYLYEGATNSKQQGRQECFNPVIMSFDFSKEIFRTIQLPFDFKLKTDEQKKSADIILFGEKIAVTCVSENYSTGCLDIWVLNENGGSESWSKFYTFVSDAYARPKFITDNGEFILLNTCKQLNVVTEEIKDLKYEGPSEGMAITRVGVYKPSLLPIAGNGATDKCLHVQV